jgi:hypothetical protein
MPNLLVERREKALQLRAAGWGYAKIGRELGVTTSRAAKMVQQELQRLLAARGDVGEAARELELSRLDSLLTAVWPAATAGDLPSWDRALACVLARCRVQGIGSKTGGKASAPAVIVQIVEKTIEDARKTVTVLDQPANAALPAALPSPASAEGDGQAEGRLGDLDAANEVPGGPEA